MRQISQTYSALGISIQGAWLRMVSLPHSVLSGTKNTRKSGYNLRSSYDDTKFWYFAWIRWTLKPKNLFHLSTENNEVSFAIWGNAWGMVQVWDRVILCDYVTIHGRYYRKFFCKERFKASMIDRKRTTSLILGGQNWEVGVWILISGKLPRVNRERCSRWTRHRTDWRQDQLITDRRSRFEVHPSSLMVHVLNCWVMSSAQNNSGYGCFSPYKPNQKILSSL